jgi:hypothetical protein
MLHRIFTNPSKQEFDILYEDLVETDDTIRAWLKVEPKEKWALLYDLSGHRYGNMTKNLLDIFNNILKIIHGLLVSVIVYIIFF